MHVRSKYREKKRRRKKQEEQQENKITHAEYILCRVRKRKYHKNFIISFGLSVSHKIYDIESHIDMGDRTTRQHQMGYLAILIAPLRA